MQNLKLIIIVQNLKLIIYVQNLKLIINVQNLKLIIVVYRKRVSSTFLHIFTHFYTFFHIFPSPSLHFPNSCHKLYYSKEKLGNPQTLLMDFLILNLKPFVSESSKKGSASKYFPKAAIIPSTQT